MRLISTAASKKSYIMLPHSAGSSPSMSALTVHFILHKPSPAADSFRHRLSSAASRVPVCRSTNMRLLRRFTYVPITTMWPSSRRASSVSSVARSRERSFRSSATCL